MYKYSNPKEVRCVKKKQIAVLLAALLSVSTAVEGTAVMGAEFSSGEETV